MMPPFFVYAVVFLSILVAIGFLACLREGTDAQARTDEPEVPAARTPLRRSIAAPEAPESRAPLRRSIAEPQALDPSRPALGVRPAPASPAAIPVPPLLRSGSVEPAALRPASGPERTTGEPAPAGDPLAPQVAELTRQVAELQAERRNFEDEIRRLQQVVQEATAAIGEFNAARPARPARSAPAGARPISLHDLRVRRLG